MKPEQTAIGRRDLLRLVPSGFAMAQLPRPASARDLKIASLKIHLPAGLLRIIVKEHELEGWCLDVSRDAADAISRHLRSRLIGRDPLAHEEIWIETRNLRRQHELSPGLFASVDAALWDLCGKIYGLPVCQVIGGFRKTIPAYLTGAVSRDEATTIRGAVQAKERGYAGYKDRHQGDINRFARSIRSAVGPEFLLMHSGEQRYTPEEALQAGKALEKSNYYWMEEPLAQPNLLGFKELSHDLDLPVAATATSMESAAQILASQGADILRMGPLRHGGLTEMLKMARAAEAFGMPLEFSPVTVMEQFAAVQVQAAVRNSEFFESRTVEASRLLKDPVKIERGQVSVPAGPGLGLTLDWNELERQTTSVI